MNKSRQILVLAAALTGASTAVTPAATLPQSIVPPTTLPTQCGTNVACVRNGILYGGSGPVQASLKARRMLDTDSPAEMRACPVPSLLSLAQRFLESIREGKVSFTVPCGA